jgi:hypothetical protein
MANTKTIRLQGTLHSFNKLRSQLLTEFPSGVTVSEPSEPKRSAISRVPLRQHPLVEFCVHILEHVVALGVVQAVRARIEEAQEKDHLIVLSGLRDDPPTSEEVEDPEPSQE